MIWSGLSNRRDVLKCFGLIFQQAKNRKKLKSKIEMAKFLQDTVEEMSLLKKGAHSEKVQEFKLFMEKVLVFD